MANTLKLPFFRYSNKNLIIKIPTIKLDNTPTKNERLKTNASKSNITAANVIGVASKNENFAALSLSTPTPLATVIVIPERDTPGNAAAIACDIPINIDCFNVISSYFVFDFDFLSTIYSIIPITINVMAIINISTFKLSPTNFSDILSNTKLNIAAGIVAITKYQNIFPSVVFSFFTT